ncbi:hypothetical protein SAMN05421863_10269 [Nitrosomonas communis]|uniref:Uncharacterized protein n=1 Tax=Nitrosomonas communis TaxID=44574 RepID=A0A1I4QCY9_9PROT|nr:hypothetical protein SAMN05421863_10269 [Nitrosomonas communis]
MVLMLHLVKELKELRFLLQLSLYRTHVIYSLSITLISYLVEIDCQL